jgi:hypothetical protein
MIMIHKSNMRGLEGKGLGSEGTGVDSLYQNGEFSPSAVEELD